MLWNWSELELDGWLSPNNSCLYGTVIIEIKGPVQKQQFFFAALKQPLVTAEGYLNDSGEWCLLMDLEYVQTSKVNQNCHLAPRGWSHNEIMYCSKCVVAVSETSTEDTDHKLVYGPLFLSLSIKSDFWPQLFAATYVCLRRAAGNALAPPSCAAYVT